MNSHLFILGVSVSAMLLTGCASTVVMDDPSQSRTDVRSENTVSSEEMRLVVEDAVKNVLNNSRFKRFLDDYKTEMNNKKARPVLKLTNTVNETDDDDNDLRTDEITDLLNQLLLDADVIDVTMAEGKGKSSALATSRNLEDDDNFDQSTVAQRGTMRAARLVMRPKVISNRVEHGGKRVVTRTFVVDIADIKTGMIIWKYTKQLGFMRNKGTFGW